MSSSQAPSPPVRNYFFAQQDVTNEIPPGLAHYAAAWSGLPLAATGTGAGLMILLLSLANSELRRDRQALFWSAVVGLAVASGWAGSTYVNTHGFEALNQWCPTPSRLPWVKQSCGP